MNKTFLATLSAILCLFTYGNSAVAQTINDQGAAKLTTIFQDFLNYQKTTNEAFGGLRLDYNGDLYVKQESNYYAITLPSITVRPPVIAYNEDGESESEIKTESVFMIIDQIKVNVIPGEQPGLWNTTWTFPEKFTLEGEDGSDDFHVEFGNQNTVAVLDESLGYFTKMNMNFQDINFKVADESIGAKIGGFQLFMNLNKDVTDGQSVYSGPFNFSLADISFAPPRDGETIKVGKLELLSSITNAVLPTLKEYEAKLLKHKDTFKSLAYAPENPEADQNMDGVKIMEMFSDLYNFKMSGFSFAYNVEDFAFLADQNNENRHIDEFLLDRAKLSVSAENMDTETGILSLRVDYDGMTVTGGEQDDLNDLSPTAANIHLQGQDIPFISLAKLAATSFRAIAEKPDSAQFVAIGLALKLPAILSQAQSKLVINDNFTKSGLYHVTLDGTVATDLTAISGFVAKLTSIFKGLDATITRLRSFEQNQAANKNRENAQDNSPAENFQPSEFLANLEALRKIAKPAANDNDAHQFDFEATPEGSFLINGTPASDVFK